MVNRGIKKYKAQKSGHFNVGVSSKTRGKYLMIRPRGYIICQSNKRCAGERFTICKFSYVYFCIFYETCWINLVVPSGYSLFPLLIGLVSPAGLSFDLY